MTDRQKHHSVFDAGIHAPCGKIRHA